MKQAILKIGAVAAVGFALAVPAQAHAGHDDDLRDVAQLAIAVGLANSALQQVHWSDYGYYDRGRRWHYYDRHPSHRKWKHDRRQYKKYHRAHQRHLRNHHRYDRHHGHYDKRGHRHERKHDRSHDKRYDRHNDRRDYRRGDRHHDRKHRRH